MTRRLTQWITTAAVALLTVTLAQAKPGKFDSLTPLERQVRHEVLMLPYYGVFDNISFRVEGNNVTLLGEVTRPILKSDAENVVKRIEGVGEVKNEIQVLPLSRFDDSVRLRVFRAIYGNNVLSPYAMGPIPSIRIIVDKGNVTLEGTVDTAMAKQIAFMQASGVSGVFSVTNNLRIG